MKHFAQILEKLKEIKEKENNLSFIYHAEYPNVMTMFYMNMQVSNLYIHYDKQVFYKTDKDYVVEDNITNELKFYKTQEKLVGCLLELVFKEKIKVEKNITSSLIAHILKKYPNNSVSIPFLLEKCQNDIKKYTTETKTSIDYKNLQSLVILNTYTALEPNLSFLEKMDYLNSFLK